MNKTKAVNEFIKTIMPYLTVDNSLTAIETKLMREAAKLYDIGFWEGQNNVLGVDDEAN
jgi:S-adenosylmethionine synthetase